MTIANDLYSILKDIYFYLDDGDRRFLNQFELSIPRFFSLKHIHDNPGISLTQLSIFMLSHKSNITRLVQGLETEGLVVRERDETDARTYQLYLTEAGQSLFNKASAAHGLFNQERFSNLDGNFEKLLQALNSVKEVLVEKLENKQQ
ncbi:MAG: MarR family transcriptional regulator [Chloroflexota bacterium]